ncbi:MAG: FixH family protein [Bacteroidia bacterium]
MKFKTILAIAFATILLATNACKKEETTTVTPTPVEVDQIPSTYKLIGETYILGAAAKAKVYSEKDLFVGYNKIFVAMYDSVSNSRLTTGHFDVIPMMDMGMMKHSAPFELEDDTLPSDKFWKAAIVFIMPSSAGKWTLNMAFHNHKTDKEGEGELEVPVINPTTSVMKSFKASDSTKLFVTLIQPATPKIGLNNFEISIHKKDMMDFPAVNDYTVEIEPTMPSMGHGSPNNVNPVFTSMGHYIGKVNFTMTGLWNVKITLKKNGVTIDNKQSFDITL